MDNKWNKYNHISRKKDTEERNKKRASEWARETETIPRKQKSTENIKVGAGILFYKNKDSLN